MAFLQAIVLGITQGITEFLPISSDGHLILVPAILGWDRFGLGFDVILHAGTLTATIAYFRHDLLRIVSAVFSKDPSRTRDRRLGWFIVWATIPSVVVALAAQGLVDGVETLPMSEQVTIVAAFLLLTAILLGSAELVSARSARRSRARMTTADLPLWKAIAIGFAQGFAVAPGLSRSGTTIAAGVALGMNREESARFSFLLSVPIIAAALAKKLLLDIVVDGEALFPAAVQPAQAVALTLAGVATTAVVGYAAISFLLPFVRKHSLAWFAAYTAVLGAGILVAQTVIG